MSDTYSQFSEVLPLGNIQRAEKIAWIRSVLECTEENLLEHVADPPEGFLAEELKKRFGVDVTSHIGDTADAWPCFDWEFDEEEATLALFSEEYFRIDHLTFFIQQYLQKFEPKAVFSLTWADHCSKLEPRCFGGGCAVVTADTITTFSTGDLVEELAEHTAKETGGFILSMLTFLGEASDAPEAPLPEGLPIVDRIDHPNKAAVLHTLEQLFGDLEASVPPAPPTVPAPVEEDYETRALRAVDAFLRAHKRIDETLGDVKARLNKDPYNAERLKEIDKLAACECDGSRFPGVILGLAHDGDTGYGWVGRCDQCATFNSDDHAAFFVARALGFDVDFADVNNRPRPYLKGLTFEQVQALERGKENR